MRNGAHVKAVTIRATSQITSPASDGSNHPANGRPRQGETRRGGPAAPGAGEVQHFRAMDIERFWDLMGRARTAAGPAADQAVRDFDEPGDDPERDYWDFDDEQFREVLANRDDLIRISSDTSADLNEVEEAEEDDDD